MSIENISKQMNRSYSSLSSKRNRIRKSLMNEKWIEDDVTVMLKYYDDHITVKEISVKLRKSELDVINKYNEMTSKYGTTNRKPAIPWTVEQEKRLMSEFASGYSFKDIGKNMKRTEKNIMFRYARIMERARNMLRSKNRNDMFCIPDELNDIYQGA